MWADGGVGGRTSTLTGEAEKEPRADEGRFPFLFLWTTAVRSDPLSVDFLRPHQQVSQIQTARCHLLKNASLSFVLRLFLNRNTHILLLQLLSFSAVASM